MQGEHSRKWLERGGGGGRGGHVRAQAGQNGVELLLHELLLLNFLPGESLLARFEICPVVTHLLQFCAHAQQLELHLP
jgi:hypothetical protein